MRGYIGALLTETAPGAWSLSFRKRLDLTRIAKIEGQSDPLVRPHDATLNDFFTGFTMRLPLPSW